MWGRRSTRPGKRPCLVRLALLAQYLDDVHVDFAAQPPADRLPALVDPLEQCLDLLFAHRALLHDCCCLSELAFPRWAGLVPERGYPQGGLVYEPLLADAPAPQLSLTQLSPDLLDGTIETARRLLHRDHRFRFVHVVGSACC